MCRLWKPWGHRLRRRRHPPGFCLRGTQLVARVPGRPNRKHFPEEDFTIDLAVGTCTCPAGQVTVKRRGRVR